VARLWQGWKIQCTELTVGRRGEGEAAAVSRSETDSVIKPKFGERGELLKPK